MTSAFVHATHAQIMLCNYYVCVHTLYVFDVETVTNWAHKLISVCTVKYSVTKECQQKTSSV